VQAQLAPQLTPMEVKQRLAQEAKGFIKNRIPDLDRFSRELPQPRSPFFQIATSEVASLRPISIAVPKIPA
jgi:hypothetical protein